MPGPSPGMTTLGSVEQMYATESALRRQRLHEVEREAHETFGLIPLDNVVALLQQMVGQARKAFARQADALRRRGAVVGAIDEQRRDFDFVEALPQRPCGGHALGAAAGLGALHGVLEIPPDA